MPARRYGEKQRLAFLALIDRGGSVRAAALTVGVHRDRGYRWFKQAGLSTSRSTQCRYTSEDKMEFFRRLALTGNVSAVARELGFNRVTCYAWAHQAGMTPTFPTIGVSGHAGAVQSSSKVGPGRGVWGVRRASKFLDLSRFGHFRGLPSRT